MTLTACIQEPNLEKKHDKVGRSAVGGAEGEEFNYTFSLCSVVLCSLLSDINLVLYLYV